MSSETAAAATTAAAILLSNGKTNAAVVSSNTAPEALAKLLTQPLEGHTASSRGLIGWMLYFIASVILAVSRIFFWTLSFATITVPTLIFKVLSVSFTLTLNFSSLYAFEWQFKLT
jgi:hypothetical protein